MFDTIVKVSGNFDKWKNNTTNVTLKTDYTLWLFAQTRGLWDIDGGTNADGIGGEGTEHARWFFDTGDNIVTLKIGWYQGDESIKNIFIFNNVPDLHVGRSGSGSFFYGGKTTLTSISWEIIKFVP